MKLLSNAKGGSSSIITLKSDDWLTKQRKAGKAAAEALLLLETEVASNTTKSLLELSEAAEDIIVKNGCTPTFKGYKGFPAAVCISVNRQLVHGIPTDRRLQDGDVVSFDLGATYDGAIADTAITCIYGTKKPEHVALVNATYSSLMAGIAAVKVGKRLGCIGDAISRVARQNGLGLITEYGGHGLDWNKPHATPFVQNKSTPEEGIVIQSGLTIAIEPMLVIGAPRTSTLPDKWTVVTEDIGAHWEHTIFVHDDYVEYITARDNESLPRQ